MPIGIFSLFKIPINFFSKFRMKMNTISKTINVSYPILHIIVD